jgi:hypothetical protein
MYLGQLWGINYHDADDVLRCLGPQCWIEVPLAELRVGDVTGGGVIGSLDDEGWPLDVDQNTMGEGLSFSSLGDDCKVEILRRDLLREGFHEAVAKEMARDSH